MNVMLVTVAQRKGEIGLLKALGARTAEIRRLFLLEAVMLSLTGASLGVVAGYGITTLVALRYPDFPVAVPWWGALSAVFTAAGFGLFFGVWPARRAALLDPVQALSGRH
jgi:putative ABC transport system permease protein